MSVFVPPPHPLLPVPTREQAMALGQDGWIETISARGKIIADEKHDPLAKGYEPPIWHVLDCLFDLPWVDRDHARRVREALGFKRVVKVCLIMGGNRASKTQYAARTVQKLLLHRKERRAWVLHSKRPMSVANHHPLMRRFLPPSLRRKIKEETTNISYSVKNGFTEDKYVLPNESICEFLNYEMDPDSFEGGELDVIWPDELVPPDLITTFELRIATRDGIMPITFTPIRGYTASVKMFQDGADIVMKSIAHLAPKDELPADVPGALGLTPAELEEINAAAAERPERAATAPQSRPEDVIARILAGDLIPQQPEGRKFELVPRVARCVVDESNPQAQQRAIVWFHSRDNPYGNPKNVVGKVLGKSRAYVLERFYGVADKLVSSRFPLFSDVHIVKPDAIPKDGTNVHCSDPSTGRNFFMLWARFTKDALYIYREWPGNYEIPGHGVPGPWTLPDGKKADGRAGPAQDSLSWGFRQYKEEIARLEGWTDAKKPMPPGMKRDDWVRTWSAEGGAAEKILERCMDSRGASNPKFEDDRPVTLLTDFEKWGLVFRPITGHGEGDNEAIREGTIEINALLSYDPEKPVDYFNQPKLYISKDCQNLIYSLRNWTGADGNKGACKDPIDVLRYLVQGGYSHVTDADWESEGGGSY